MKRKKLNKKLLLNKETISNIDADQLSGIKGGLSMGSICCPDTLGCGPYTNPIWNCDNSLEMTCTIDPQSQCI